VKKICFIVSKIWLNQGCQIGLSVLILSGLFQKEGGNPALAQVIADPSLGTEVIPNGDNLEIRGGTTVGNTNLFHSFSSFSVIKNNEVVDFRNAPTINNILVRVTGGNPSDIQGILKAQGNANLFLLNPKGIIFGESARLDIGGSFVGTTATAIQFPGGGEFSITSPVNSLNPLLTVNPSALLFNQIATESPGSIQVNEARLSVPDGQSLLLVGGDVNLEGGILEATSGRIDLGGLVGVGTIGLNIDNNNFRLNFPNDVARADVFLSNQAIVAAPDSAGSIQVQGRNVELTDNSEIRITNTFGAKPAGALTINASQSVKLRGGSSLLAVTEGTGEDAGKIRIETGRLIVQDGSKVSASTRSQGQGGTLFVTAKESSIVENRGSGLFAGTRATGNAGNLEIETGQLIVRDGARISASTSFESSGEKGSIMLRTGELNVLSGAEVAVNNEGSGDAGLLRVNANSIKLDRGKISATTALGRGGNISLQVQDLILMRHGSAIATSAANNGSGGNITINTPFIVAVPNENSDIIANADRGSGGRIGIKSTGIYGLEKRDRPTLKSDINASSNVDGLDGVVEISRPDVDPNNGLVNLPTVPVNTRVTQTCSAGGSQAQSKFTIVGRGGLPQNPGEALSTDAVQVDLITLKPEANKTSTNRTSTSPNSHPSAPIVEATGWVTDANGNVVLTANSTTTPYNSWQKIDDCRGLNPHR
jgi:filamentous hemagglutinin family protein